MHCLDTAQDGLSKRKMRRILVRNDLACFERRSSIEIKAVCFALLPSASLHSCAQNGTSAEFMVCINNISSLIKAALEIGQEEAERYTAVFKRFVGHLRR